VLNEFVATHKVRKVIEFGCGDGNQLLLARYPVYMGFDVSETAIAKCRDLFRSDPDKSFRLVAEYDGDSADLVLSLDVIYHLVEDEIFESYMRTLFSAAVRYVIVYSSNHEGNRGLDGNHVRHREFTKWVRDALPDWHLIGHVPNRYPYRGDHRTGSFADFYVYEKR
jgi:trans-aconitate methyltransferase